MTRATSPRPELRPDPATPGSRAALAACAGAAVALVVLRALVPWLFEQIFDSDQAIVGLMAKHLSEFRWFPLFFYGQHYMLGVQAWMAAPFFWVGGATVTMLRTPLLIINAVVAALLVREIARRGVRPALALTAALPFAAATPLVANELMYALGASVEPFLYVLGLWALRNRPLAFGALAGVGFLHREFTAFALPAFAVAGWREWRSWRAAGITKAACGFAAIWLVVAMLKPQINTYGPGGGAQATGSLVLQIGTVLKRLSFAWEPYLGRLGDVLLRGVPEMFGAGPVPLRRFGINSTLSQGRNAAALCLAVAAAVALARLAWLAWKRERQPAGDSRFFLYLGLVAVQTALAYGLGGGLPVGAPIVHAYLLLVTLLPVAVFARYFQRETARRWRLAVGLLVVLWAASGVWDHLRLLREYLVEPPPSQHRAMADYLTSNDIRYGRAVYWDAYVITFLSQERTIITPNEVVRISAYKALVDANDASAVTLVRQPCSAGTRVAAWCVVDPLDRTR